MIINLTPHPVTVVRERNYDWSDGLPRPFQEYEVVKSFPAAEKPCRLSVKTEQCGEVDGIPISRTLFGDVQNLPPAAEGTYYIVSQLVKNNPALRLRTDLLVPAETVRDGDPVTLLGCRSLGI